ncbi:MAG: hypothetical protein LBU08_00725 [Tannerellaceae bacterium]|nr:hypothetical protein [Tannerellaceae bacterium]
MFRKSFLSLVLLLCSCYLFADPNWRENMKNLIYSPRYFGPNAFPLPDLRSALIPYHSSLEFAAERHRAPGDYTKDYLFRFLFPVVKGRAALEIFFIFKEEYQTTRETLFERHADATSSPIPYAGDVVLTSSYQLLRHHPALPDLLLHIGLKTASGGRLVDARFTDAAAYWIHLALGRSLFASPQASIQLLAMAGFYCWMTNDLVHRQNDALLYGAGFAARLHRFSLTSDLSGIYGYEDNGDRPIHLRNALSCHFQYYSLSLRFSHGFQDRLYNSCALACTLTF